MKNVLIFTLTGRDRYAVELRWVREIFTLGSLTTVPTAPACVAGVVNFEGSIVPVIWAPHLLGQPGPSRTPRPGDTLVLVEVDATRVALAVDRIDAVTTLAFSDRGGLIDSRGEVVPVLDPPTLLADARAQVGLAAARVRELIAGVGE